MPGSEQTEFQRILMESDREARLDRLSQLVIQARSRIYQPGSVDAAELCSAVRKEDNHLLRAVLWEIIEYAVPDACLRRLAEETLAVIDGDYRDYAFSYLARSYPELREDLDKKYAEDSDPFLQDALARFCSNTSPSKALEHWMRCLESPHLPAELEEMIPFSIATVATVNDLAYFEQRSKEAGASPIWKVAADMTRQRLREPM